MSHDEICREMTAISHFTRQIGSFSRSTYYLAFTSRELKRLSEE